jgi:hypothetical protein
VADDWVTKGFHIRVNGIELAVRPDHEGGVTFVSVFSSPEEADVQAAIRRATRECLDDGQVRTRWSESIQRAKLHLISFEGELQPIARGRLMEMRFLEIALQRYEEQL